MTNVTPLRRKLTPSEERSLRAWEKAKSGEGMSLSEASATLESIGYNQDWSFEQLIEAVEAVPEVAIDQIVTALDIAAGAHFAEAEALDSYKIQRRGEA